MAITTLDTATAVYLENADYDSPASLPKARAFRVACRQLLILLPSATTRAAGGNQQHASFRIEAIERSLQEVEAWIASVDDAESTAAVTHPNLRDWRD